MDANGDAHDGAALPQGEGGAGGVGVRVSQAAVRRCAWCRPRSKGRRGDVGDEEG